MPKTGRGSKPGDRERVAERMGLQISGGASRKNATCEGGLGNAAKPAWGGIKSPNDHRVKDRAGHAQLSAQKRVLDGD